MSDNRVRIVEVGPRDGLQNESVMVPTEVKVAFIDALSESGVSEIEVSSFVSPKWIPQLADAREVFEKIKRNPDVVYSALVPNQRGLERALEVSPDSISIFTAVSETFNRKNINASIDESFERFVPIFSGAAQAALPVRGYVSTVFWCPYEGKMPVERVVKTSQRLLDLGCTSVSLGDTIGKASPDDVREVLDALLKAVAPEKLALHFHDTFGRALANVEVGYNYGIRVFDASVGGLGGCPYAGAGAPGNVATTGVVKQLRKLGGDSAVDLAKLSVASQALSGYVSARD